MKREWNWMNDPVKVSELEKKLSKDKANLKGFDEGMHIKCIRPLVHVPQFEGKHHCMHCAREAKSIEVKKDD